MPELPEVETVRRGLAPVMEGRRIAAVALRRDGLRWPFPPGMAGRLEGARVLRLRRRSKYILADLDTGETLLVHLGMSGRMLIAAPSEQPAGVVSAAAPPSPIPSPQGGGEPPVAAGAHAAGAPGGTVTLAAPSPLVGEGGGGGAPAAEAMPGRFLHPQAAAEKHDHVVLWMEGGARITFNDARRFGAMDLLPTEGEGTHRLLAALGPEPLGNGFHADHLRAGLAGRATAIKPALLDQRLVAGLGNIYVCEALFRAGIAPWRRAGRIAPRRIEALVPAIRAVLEEAIAAGGSSLRDHRQTDGALGYFQHNFRVYGREGAACVTPGCSAEVRRRVQGGRSSFWCPACQR